MLRSQVFFVLFWYLLAHMKGINKIINFFIEGICGFWILWLHNKIPLELKMNILNILFVVKYIISNN